MPQFAYHSVDRFGRKYDGTMAAENERVLDSKLRDIGYWLIDAREQSPRQSRNQGKVPRRELIDFFTGSTSLLIAGIPIATTISAMAEETEHPALKTILKDISLNVQAGNEVSASLRSYPGVFSDQVCNLVRAGEQSGSLTQVFKDIAEHLEWVDRIMADVRQATIYPAMILSAVAGLVALMFVFVVPRFAALFGELDIALPALTRGVVRVGEIAQSYWWVGVAAIVAAVVGLRVIRAAHPSLAYQLDNAKLNMPVFGGVRKMLVQSQFVHNLALMLKAGVPILDALKLSRGVSSNLVMDKVIDEAVTTVESGGRISTALRDQPVISSLTLRMIVVGEESGRIETTLQQVADRYDEEIPRQIKRVFAIVEPMITLVLVAVVGLIAGSLFLPMFALISGLNA
ncbi:MAG: type II secretion system F family protein [Pseudomonadota bacterium]